MPQNPVVLSLFVVIGLVFGTVGLLTARTDPGRLLTAAAGYLLASWHGWVLAFGGWCLPAHALTMLLDTALLAVLVQSAILVVRSLRRAADQPPRPPVRIPMHAPPQHGPPQHTPAQHAPAQHAPAQHAPALHTPAKHTPAHQAPPRAPARLPAHAPARVPAQHRPVANRAVARHRHHADATWSADLEPAQWLAPPRQPGPPLFTDDARVPPWAAFDQAGERVGDHVWTTLDKSGDRVREPARGSTDSAPRTSADSAPRTSADDAPRAPADDAPRTSVRDWAAARRP